MMIDTHCHLYVKEFQQDINTVISEAEIAGVKKFFLPAIDASSHKSMLEIEKRFPAQCVAMMGLHPCSVKENYTEELALVTHYLKERPFAAIGEAGLDFYWDKTYIKEQYAALHFQIDLALQYALPLVLHTRDAMQETIDVIKGYQSSGLKGIFHCFGGTLHEAQQIIECGFLLGIGGVVTYKKAGLHEVLPQIGIEHIVLETDAPYLSPVPYRGKRNESKYLAEIAKKIAEIKNLSVDEVAEATTANAKRIFQKSF